jgi:hypothetical protein
VNHIDFTAALQVCIGILTHLTFLSGQVLVSTLSGTPVNLNTTLLSRAD